MSYGTPESLEDVEAYYTHIRRGNAPSAEQLKELTDRYKAIVGGVFPLRENTDRQVEALQAKLNSGQIQYVCYQGLNITDRSSRMVSRPWSGTELLRR